MCRWVSREIADRRGGCSILSVSVVSRCIRLSRPVVMPLRCLSVYPRDTVSCVKSLSKIPCSGKCSVVRLNSKLKSEYPISAGIFFDFVVPHLKQPAFILNLTVNSDLSVLQGVTSRTQIFPWKVHVKTLHFGSSKWKWESPEQLEKCCSPETIQHCVIYLLKPKLFICIFVCLLQTFAYVLPLGWGQCCRFCSRWNIHVQ